MAEANASCVEKHLRNLDLRGDTINSRRVDQKLTIFKALWLPLVYGNGLQVVLSSSESYPEDFKLDVLSLTRQSIY